MRDLQFELAVTGDLERVTESRKVQYLTAVKESVQEEAKDVQQKLRDDVTGAGLGQKVANAWRLEVYPARSLSYTPSALLFSRAAHIIEAHSRGEPIRAKSGSLAVPIPGTPAAEVRVPRGGGRVELMRRRFGELTLIVNRRGLAMLVANNVRQTVSGRYRANTGRSQGRVFSRLTGGASLPLFWIVREVRMQKRLNWEGIAQEAEPGFRDRVEGNLRRRLESQGVSDAATGALPRGFD